MDTNGRLGNQSVVVVYRQPLANGLCDEEEIAEDPCECAKWKLKRKDHKISKVTN